MDTEPSTSLETQLRETIDDVNNKWYEIKTKKTSNTRIKVADQAEMETMILKATDLVTKMKQQLADLEKTTELKGEISVEKTVDLTKYTELLELGENLRFDEVMKIAEFLKTIYEKTPDKTTVNEINEEVYEEKDAM